MKTFSHSGTTGDVFNSLSVVKALGGGHLYLKLYNMDRMIQEKLGWAGAGYHSGRMTHDDFASMEEFILHQPFITGFSIWNGEPVDHDLDEMARYHNLSVFPRNFPNLYAASQQLDLDQHREVLQVRPYMECREPKRIPNRPIVVFRGRRYQEGNQKASQQWQEWIDWGLLDQAFFVGLEDDHKFFCESFNVDIQHVKTNTMWEMAQLISGSEMLITSMSSPCAIGLALGKTMWIETRKNIEMERLEVNYPYRTNIFYF